MSEVITAKPREIAVEAIMRSWAPSIYPSVNSASATDFMGSAVEGLFAPLPMGFLVDMVPLLSSESGMDSLASCLRFATLYREYPGRVKTRKKCRGWRTTWPRSTDHSEIVRTFLWEKDVGALQVLLTFAQTGPGRPPFDITDCGPHLNIII